MKTKPYVVRAYLLSQHVMPYMSMPMETKDLAVALAEILLGESHIHYVTITNHHSDEDVIAFKKELVMKV